MKTVLVALATVFCHTVIGMTLVSGEGERLRYSLLGGYVITVMLCSSLRQLFRSLFSE